MYLFILEDHDICGVCEIQCNSPHNKINSKTKSMFIISVFVELKRSNKKSCIVSMIKLILCLTKIGLLSKNVELQHYLHFLIAFTFPHL